MWVLRCRLKVSTVRQDLMSDGSKFQVRGAATENARRASSLRVHGTVSSGASDDRRGRTGIAVWIRSLKYAGVAEDILLERQ